MSDFVFTDINRLVSDKSLLYTFTHILLQSVLGRPVSKSTLKKYQNEYFHYQRYECLFKKDEFCGYLILRFIESCIWLFRNLKVRLDDDKFENGTDEILQVIMEKERDETKIEDLKKYFNVTTYAVNINENKEVVNDNESLITDFGDFTMNEFDKRAKTLNKEGQFKWGPVYWAFIHRYVYKLESKLILTCEKDAVVNKIERQLIKNAFLTLYFVFKIFDELLLCGVCSNNYVMSGFGDELTKTLMLYYPHDMFASNMDEEWSGLSAELSNSTNYCYKLRLFSLHLFLLHHLHTFNNFYSNDTNVEYDVHKFLEDLSSVQRQD